MHRHLEFLTSGLIVLYNNSWTVYVIPIPTVYHTCKSMHSFWRYSCLKKERLLLQSVHWNCCKLGEKHRFRNIFTIAFYRRITLPLEVCDRNNVAIEFRPIIFLKVENPIYRAFHVFDPYVGKEVKLGGSFWFRWKAHTRFPDTCSLKLFQNLERFSHTSLK